MNSSLFFRRYRLVFAILIALSVIACSDTPVVEPSDTALVDASGADTAPATQDIADTTEATDTAVPDTNNNQEPDTAPSDTAGEDIQDVSSEDTTPAPDAADVADVLPDVADWETIKSDCEELGVADSWTGTFEGVIEHDVIPPDGINLIDEPIPVDGKLSFAITCVDSKFQVNGKLDGFGVAQGESYPFTLTLKGYYNPKTGALNADITEGKVLLLDAIEVYFKGAFNGNLGKNEADEDQFTGTWSAETTGTNAGELIQGEAWGDGSWVASADE